MRELKGVDGTGRKGVREFQDEKGGRGGVETCMSERQECFSCARYVK